MIDKKAITLYFDDDHELFKRFVSSFVAQTPGLIRSIKHSIAKEQFQEASTAIHTLKGHLRYLGLESLASQLQKMEQKADQRVSAKVLQTDWQRFNRAFTPAYNFLKKY